MKLNLTDLKKPKIETVVSRGISHDDLQLKLEVKHDEAFNSAFGKVAPLLDVKKVGKNDLKRESQSDITNYEMLLFVIGEYCIKSWNITDENDKDVPINGDNFLLVLNAVPNLQDFITNLLHEFGAMINEFGEKAEKIKKKPKATT